MHTITYVYMYIHMQHMHYQPSPTKSFSKGSLVFSMFLILCYLVCFYFFRCVFRRSCYVAGSHKHLCNGKWCVLDIHRCTWEQYLLQFSRFPRYSLFFSAKNQRAKSKNIFFRTYFWKVRNSQVMHTSWYWCTLLHGVSCILQKDLRSWASFSKDELAGIDFRLII